MRDQIDERSTAPKQARQVVIHPFLFALNPIVFHYAQAFAFVDPFSSFRSIIVSLTATALVWMLLRFLLGDLRRSALATSLGTVLSFAHLAVAEKLAEHGLFRDAEWSVGANVVLLTAGTAAWAGITLLLAKREISGGWTYFANVFGLVAVIFPFAVVVQAVSTAYVANQSVEWMHQSLPTAGRDATEDPPDIYWIIPDGYPRADVLAKFHGYDDEPFLNALRERGFTIPPRAVAHYSKTASSVASTLNFDYLQDLVSGELKHVFDWRFVRRLLRENRVSRFLKNRGYNVYTVVSQYDNLSWYSDRAVSPWWFLNYFEVRLVGRTPLPSLTRMAGVPILYEHHRARTRHALEWISHAAELPGAKMVLVQVVTPHPPFIFGPSGEAINPPRRYAWSEGLGFQNQPGGSVEEYREGYLNQVRYIHKPLIEAVDWIQKSSERPPVILIMSDHGPASGEWLRDLSSPEAVERFGVLCALSMPGVEPHAIPDDLAAVNVFRLIFNEYFDTKLEILGRKHFHVEGDLPYYYMPVEWSEPVQPGHDAPKGRDKGPS